MKLFFIITLFTTVITHTTYSQQKYIASIEPCQNSNWKLKVDVLSKEEFDQTKKIPYVEEKEINGDSLLEVKAKEFPMTIKVKDSCCILYGLDKEIKLCRKAPIEPGDDSFYGYEVKGFKNGYLILLEYAYESWAYIIFNPVTQKYAYFGAMPMFLTKELLYACSLFYYIGDFQLTDIENNKTFCFEGEWAITGFYHDEKFIYIEINGSWNSESTIFLRVKYT